MNFDVPWPLTPWNEIVRGLYQGGHWCRYGLDSAVPVKVGYQFALVVSLYKEFGHFGPASGIEHIYRGIPDGELTAEQLAKVTALVPRIVDALADGHKVLVRCQAGYNRSGLVVALVLLAKGYSADDAIALIREKRSEYALYNENFVEYIHAAAAEVTR